MRRWMAGAAPWALVTPGAVWAVVWLGGWDRWHPVAQLIAFTPYVAAASVLPLVGALLLAWRGRRARPGWRRWAAPMAAAMTTVTLVACVAPRALPDADPLAGAAGPVLRVMTANVLKGLADPASLLRLVREHHVDVLALQEVTPEFMPKLDTLGVTETLPHRVVYPQPGVVGSAILSRHRLLDDGLRVHPLEFGQARVALPEYGLLIESVHPVAPAVRSWTPLWRRSLADQPPATVDGPLRVLAGDFNATLDHSLLRELLATGYRDAADVVGKGLTGTWGPYDGDRIPPVALDRVVADRRIGVRDVHVFDLAGSDHRPVLATLVLPS